MTPESSCFNLKLINLFIGLFDDHVFLRPHSKFICELGYQIHSIEPSFSSQGRTINPEAIAYSSNRKHTLLTEWTAANSLSYEKREQIQRYLLVSEDDLRSNAGVNQDACSSCSLWITVLPTSVKDFEDIINNSNRDRLLLSSFFQAPTGEYRIEFFLGNVADDKLASILTKNMSFTKIPEGYLNIPIENMRDKRFTDGVIREIIAFLIKNEYEFSIEEICKSMMGIWNYFPSKKKRAIRKAVRRVMKNLHEQNYFKNLLIYESGSWKAYNMSPSKLTKFLNSVEPDKINLDK